MLLSHHCDAELQWSVPRGPPISPISIWGTEWKGNFGGGQLFPTRMIHPEHDRVTFAPT